MAGSIGLKAIFSAEDKLTGPVGRMERSIKQLTTAGQEGLGKLGQLSDSVFGKLKTVGLAATTALGVGAGFMAKHVIESGADFEQSITNVGAVMGKSRGEISLLEKQALSLGVSTKFSANEVAGGMEIMARKGFDADEILAGIPGTLDAVAASGEGTEEVFTAVTSSLRGFGLQAKDTSHVADVLALATEKTGAGITNLGTSLAIAAPTARALGVSIEDVAAGAGLLQKMGLDASTAGSSIATMLAKISHPSKDAAQQMAALGLKFQDAKGDMLPFRDVLGQFVKAGDKTTGNMKLMGFFAELVGLRGDKAALGLRAMAQSGEFDSLVKGLKNVDGYAHKVAGLRMNTTAASWKLLTSTVEVLETNLFNLGSGGLKDAIDKTNAWLSANQDLIVSGASGFVKTLADDAESLADNIGFGVSMLDNFRDGVVDAFGDNKKIKLFGDILGGVFGGDDKTGPRMKAYELGRAVVDLTTDMAMFIFVTKGLQGVIWGIENATKVAKAARWMWDLGGAATAAVKGFGALQQVGPAGIVSMGNAINGVGNSFEGVAGSVGRFAMTREVVNGVFDSWAMKAGLATAAVYALSKAYEQAAAFGNENGGWEGLKGFVGAGPDPTKFGYEGIDAAMNEQARRRRESEDAGTVGFSDTVAGAPLARAYDAIGAPRTAPMGTPGGYAGAFGLAPPPAGMPSPAGMAPPPAAPPVAPPPSLTQEALHAAVSQALEVTIKTQDGTTAEVTKKPPGAKVNLAASGAP